LGHAPIQTTVDAYGHLVPGPNRNAVSGLNDTDDVPLEVVLAEPVSTLLSRDIEWHEQPGWDFREAQVLLRSKLPDRVLL